MYNATRYYLSILAYFKRRFHWLEVRVVTAWRCVTGVNFGRNCVDFHTRRFNSFKMLPSLATVPDGSQPQYEQLPNTDVQTMLSQIVQLVYESVGCIPSPCVYFHLAFI